MVARGELAPPTSGWVSLRQRGADDWLVPRVRCCAAFFCKLRGLSFRRRLAAGEGLLFVDRYESRVATAIHMLFMFFPIGVLWLDAGGRVVDTCLARPWRLIYAPRGPARYVLETSPAVLDAVQPGDTLEWVALD
ncbi:MAG: DUF192 domain-containing protein [Anaerolineales bacterium]